MMNLDEMYATALVNRRTREPVDVMRDGTEMLHLAQADDFTAMGTEMAGGTEPPGATPMTLRQFGETVADTPASLLKGRLQGQAGLIGDTIAFGRGIGAAINPNPGESRLDAFLRALGDPVKVFGYDITTEGISKILDETLGPVVPAGSRPGRAEVAKTGETVGEIFGFSKAASEAFKAAGSGARAISREIATTPPTGAINVAGLPNKGKDFIQSSAEELSAKLKQLGFQADVTHSGSVAGPSSYVRIYDPETGRMFTNQIRFSGHSKGPREAAGVTDIQDPTTDIPNIVQEALEMRSLGPSEAMIKAAQRQSIVDELIAGGMRPKQAYKEADLRMKEAQ